MKTILIPTDFSVPADYAIRYATALAKQFNSSLILYHAFIPFKSGFYSYSQSAKENLETENTLIKRLERIKNKLLKTDKALSVSVHVDRGPESILLAAFCKKKKIDLVVMGTTGATGLKEVIMGSFTADTISKAPCPVLAIPRGCQYKTPEKITFASDYHKGDVRAIRFLAEWNLPFNAQINILHIDDEESDGSEAEKLFNRYKRKTEKQCGSIALRFQHEPGKDTAAAILHLTANDGTDLLAMSPVTRKSFWNSLFHKSITKETAYRIRIPLLAIPIKKN